MEVYLNSIEWGPGVYGAEKPPPRPMFHVSAAQAEPRPEPRAWRRSFPSLVLCREELRGPGPISRNAAAT